MKISKWLCAVLVAALALAGPLGSWTVMAQTPQSAPQPAPSLAMPAYSGPPGPSAEPTAGDYVGAFFLNTVYVPGKFIVCGAGVLASSALMLLTFGTAYRTAVSAFKEGCGGPWVLTGAHVSGKLPPRDDIPD